jgi:DNA-binding transcriptional MerR regulator
VSTERIAGYHGISEVAEFARVTPWTLRNYERQGLLNPSRDSTGRRVYNSAELHKARQIADRKRVAPRFGRSKRP